MSKRRATLTELAAEAGVTVGTIRYRVQRRQMTPPDRHGRFDAARVLAEQYFDSDRVLSQLLQRIEEAA